MRLLQLITICVVVGVYGVRNDAAAQVRNAFDVASVKLHVAADGPQSVVMEDRPGAVHYSNVALKSCILAAYGIKDSQLEGLEGHQPERYDIEAKSDVRATGIGLMEMLQNLLEGRFNLKFHAGAKTIPVYQLLPSKKPRLSAVARPESGLEFSNLSTQRLTGQASLQHLATFLSGLLDRPVVDKTGLPGVYEVLLEWNTGTNRDQTQDALFAAIERGLGLRLETGSDSVKTMIIDHFDKVPTRN